MDFGNITNSMPTSNITSASNTVGTSAPSTSSTGGTASSTSTPSSSMTSTSLPAVAAPSSANLNYSSDFKSYDGYGNLNTDIGVNGGTGDIGGDSFLNSFSSADDMMSFMDSTLASLFPKGTDIFGGSTGYTSNYTPGSGASLVSDAQNSDMGQFMTSMFSAADAQIAEKNDGLGLGTFNPTTYMDSDYNDGR